MLQLSKNQFKRIQRYNNGKSIRSQFLTIFNNITKQALGPLYYIIDHKKVNNINIRYYDKCFKKYLESTGHYFCNSSLFGAYTPTYGNSFIVNAPRIPILNILSNFGQTIFHAFDTNDMYSTGCDRFEEAISNHIEKMRKNGINKLTMFQKKFKNKK
jgi:hypothetical protein